MFCETKRNLSPEEKRFFYLCAFTVALLFSSIVPQSTFARTWYIKADGTGDAPTIQAGVDSAAVGDTVLVGAGTYTDTTHVMVAGVLRAVNVHIQKQVTLLGESPGDRPFIDGAQSYVGIFVESVGPTVLIGHLRLKGTAFVPSSSNGRPSAQQAARDYSARVRCHSSSIGLKDMVISNDHDGVFLSNSTADIRDSKLHTLSMAILGYDGSFAVVSNDSIFNGPVGVECDHSSATVNNNTFGAPPPAGQTVSIYCLSSSVDVQGNIMSWSSGGVTAIESQVLLRENRLLNMEGTGVYLANSAATISNNTFYRGAWAVWSISGTTGEVSSNTIDGYDIGVRSELGASQVIRNNIISGGYWGVVCDNSYLTVECNDIFDMKSGTIGWSCIGQPGEGNFSLDPEFCGVDDSGNYFLQSDSPCAPGNHPLGQDCGLVGALPVNCGKVEARRSTWGSIKDIYRDGGEP